jgi:hypothetical protein
MTTEKLPPFEQSNFRLMAIDRVWDLEMIGGIVELIDSGVAFWAFDEAPEPHELPLLFVLTEQEALTKDGPQTHRLDLATVALGINRIMSGSCEVNVDAIGNIAKFVATNDLSHIDIEDMDLIVQAGIYGKIMFG